MAEERRSAPRARISGVRVTYEGATGDHVETDALNLGRGGLFVRATKPFAIGKRLALDVHIAGELVPWSALGRVVWARQQEDAGDRGPPGMGVKFIDVDDAVVATIDRLVAGAESQVAAVQVATTVPAPAEPVAPSRERTILGIGSIAPDAPTIPPPERTFPRTPSVAPRTPSVAIDLVASHGTSGGSPQPARTTGAPTAVSPRRDPPSNDDVGPQSYDAAPTSEGPPEVKRRSGTRWGVVLLMLLAAAVAAYAVLDGDLDRILRPAEPVTVPPTAPTPPVSVPTSTTAPSSVPVPTATANPSSSAPSTAPTPAPSFGLAAPRKPMSAAPAGLSVRPPTVKRPSTDENNPY